MKNTSRSHQENTRPQSKASSIRMVLRSMGRASMLLILLSLFAQTGFAMPLPEYREQVRIATHYLEALRPGVDHPSLADDPFVALNVPAARRALPPREIVEWNGTKVEVDNSWLEDQLKEIERTSAPVAQRAVALERAIERLKGLEVRLDELEKATNSSALDKAEMRDRLASILQRPEYADVVKEEPALTRLMKWIIKWLNSLLPEQRAISPGRAVAVSRFAQIVVILIALAAIAYALWMFAPRFLYKRKTKKPVKSKARIVLGERLEPDKSATDLLSEAEALARSGDLRGAIRRGYIALLIELADRKVISLAQYKTNRDYLRSVREIRKLYSNMEVLTNNFELHWYGLAEANQDDWAAFRAGYKEAITSA